MIEYTRTALTKTLEDPLGIAMGLAWWILCLGLGAWVLRGVIGFVFMINGF